MDSPLPRLMLTAPASGGGKTTLAIGLLRLLLNRGMRPAAFKCGPDFIDPLFHREVLGVPGRNLDLFFTPPAIVRGLLVEGALGADLAIIEGVMGHYDGVGDSTRASAWQVALETRTPAVLVLRPAGAFLSLAALARGFASFRKESMLRGVVLNRCGGRLHDKLAPVLEREAGLRVYGHVPDCPEAALESRHLGLVTPDAVAALREKTALLAERMAGSVDVEGLLELARTAPPLGDRLPVPRRAAESPVRVAVARDEAFCFQYEENLELLRAFGAEIVFFSPLRDGGLPADIGGLCLGGGYPEVHAARLAANASMLRSVKEAVASGTPTLAECGGFLYLHEGVEDDGGVRRVMAGVFPGVARRAAGPRRFGYVTLAARRNTPLLRAGEETRAHEFHYWDSDDPGDAFVARKADGESWGCVRSDGNLMAGFPHLYFWSEPAMAERFVAAAARKAGVGGGAGK